MRNFHPRFIPGIDPKDIATNLQQRAAVLNRAKRFTQQIASQGGINPANTPFVQINVQPTGLVVGFIIEITGTLTNTGTSTALSPTGWNVANVLAGTGGIYFQDTQNNVRVNTSGWHLAALNTARRMRTFGAALTSDSPIFGANEPAPIAAPATIPATSGNVLTFKMTYHLPLAYADQDLRGSMYANLVNSTSFLKLTFNTQPIIASGDPQLAMYTGNTGTLTNVNVTVYQQYLDQLPAVNGAIILPQVDMSHLYQIQNTNATAVQAGQDYPMQYTSYRQYLSTVSLYNTSAAPAATTDITYWAIQAANTTNIYKAGPNTTNLFTRDEIADDLPKGGYYFDHTQDPIYTNVTGNMALILNAANASTGYVLLGYEFFSLANVVIGGPTLPGG